MSELLKRAFTGTNSVRGASAIMIVTLLLSNILGLIRDRFLAQKIPTEFLDTYFAAFRIPDLVFNVLILGAVSAAFVPLLTEYFHKNEAEGWKVANAILNLAMLILTTLAIFMVIIMPYLIPLIVPSFDFDRQNLTIELARILMIQPIFFSASYLFSGMLTAQKRFVSYAIAPLIYNLSIIIATIIFADAFSVKAVITGVIIGAFLHMLIQLFSAIGIGWRWQFSFDFKHPAIKKVVLLMLPRSVGLGGMQIVLVIFTAIASTLAAGSIAVYNLADNIQTMPLAVFAISFATALFPTLSDAYTKKDETTFSNYLIQGIRSIAFLTIPSAIGILLLRAQIVRLILGSGYFDWSATVATADALGYFALSLFSAGLVHLLARAFYARQNTRVPMFIAIISYVIMIVVGYLLSSTLGVAGLSIGFTIGQTIQAILLYLLLRQKLPTLKKAETKLAEYGLQLVLATAVLVFVVQGVKIISVDILGADMTRAWGVLVQTVLSIIAGSISYLFVARILVIPEVTIGWGMIKNKLKK